jgi:hypothetical protein
LHANSFSLLSSDPGRIFFSVFCVKNQSASLPRVLVLSAFAARRVNLAFAINDKRMIKVRRNPYSSSI